MSITGERLRMQRKRYDLSADEVAAKLKVSRSTIFRYENGYIEKVPSSILEKLADILHTTPDYLAGWTDDPHTWERNENKAESHPIKNINKFSSTHLELENYVNMLNERGKEKVIDYARDLSMNPIYQKEPVLNAAHERTDIEVSDEMRRHDDNIMDDDSEWE